MVCEKIWSRYSWERLYLFFCKRGGSIHFLGLPRHFLWVRLRILWVGLIASPSPRNRLVFAHGWGNIHELGGQSNGDGSLTYALTHSLTHSILINLFTKLELSNFLLPPLPSIVFWRGETSKAFIFVESLGKNLSSASAIVGSYGFFSQICCFLTIGFCSDVDGSW